jgi:hypothetical protein
MPQRNEEGLEALIQARCIDDQGLYLPRLVHVSSDMD